jgi:hypothetical protein
MSKGTKNMHGFCPDFTDTSKKPYDRQKECLCRREENIAPSSNGGPLNRPVNRGSVVRSSPGSWVLMPQVDPLETRSGA